MCLLSIDKAICIYAFMYSIVHEFIHCASKFCEIFLIELMPLINIVTNLIYSKRG